jgi:diguanylate cyclase (GGDEF)-like protein
MNAAIETHRLTKRYGQSRGIEELDLRVEQGEVFGFLGPNGSGRTKCRICLGGAVTGPFLVKSVHKPADRQYVRVERRSGVRTRSGELRRLQRRFTLRWTAGVAIGFALVAVDWVRHRTDLATASRATRDSPLVTAALSRLHDSNDQLAIGAVIALVALATLLFRPLDRALRREGEWISEVEDTQRQESLRQRFAADLREAFEMARDEAAIETVVTHVLGSTVPDNPAELKLADSSEAHLSVRLVNPIPGRAGCDVTTPFDCPAIRKATPQIFSHSTALNACPHLRDRPGDALSALCVPVAFMGRALGVLHVTGEVDRAPDGETADRMVVLAAQTGSALGTVRAFSKAQLQANTDSLTGLSNRRSAEDQLTRRIAAGESFAIVMADLDQFKKLNDTYGHDVGDRAIRLFADTVRAALGPDDIIARWGGEEFVIALADHDRRSGVAVLDTIRTMLADACMRAALPLVTASFGVADTTESSALDRILRRADDALLCAKDSGRDCVRVSAIKPSTEREPDHLRAYNDHDPASHTNTAAPTSNSHQQLTPTAV